MMWWLNKHPYFQILQKILFFFWGEGRDWAYIHSLHTKVLSPSVMTSCFGSFSASLDDFFHLVHLFITVSTDLCIFSVVLFFFSLCLYYFVSALHFNVLAWLIDFNLGLLKLSEFVNLLSPNIWVLFCYKIFRLCSHIFLNKRDEMVLLRHEELRAKFSLWHLRKNNFAMDRTRDVMMSSEESDITKFLCVLNCSHMLQEKHVLYQNSFQCHSPHQIKELLPSAISA